DEDREWMSRAMAGVLVVAVVWMALCGAVLVLPEWALDWRVWGHGLLGAATVAAGWLSTLGGKADAGQGHGGGGATSRLKATAGRLAPPVFIVLLAGALSVLTNVLLQGMHALAETPILSHQGQPVTWRDHYAILEGSHPIQLVLLAAVLLLVSWIMARYVNINTFSLHAMYRDRLIRAYLGASNRDREASPFTGFAPDDDIPMAALDPQRRPFHVVNLALNLVSGSRLAWQQRKADSFTVTPLHCGNAQLGFRPSAEYAGGITLGTAVALSGAAASPNMGYHSTPVVGFVMTLFNTRLGAWLGNPGAPGRRTWRLPGPLSAIGSLIKEALGQTSDRTPFVYLSDGGHFENLALYEMVRRGCRQIVVLDSGCDQEFRYDDLGNALRKIRIDLGVPITFADAHMQPLRDRERRCAVATVEYSKANPGAQDGVLIYLKPLLRGNESPDVASYAAGHPAFPHQTTADQWFDESQTESYRALGLHTVDEICRGWKGESLESLRDHIQEVYLARD
ncbi:MAG TPA: hypothetical protein VLA43_05815, partial [Longimicrobiales bacterium]|nr:hypothetical protein [Longimicrobiales bacterium]